LGRNTAILVSSGSEAAKISAALNSELSPVKHKLLFDEAEALLAARFAAFLLEPKLENQRSVDLAHALELLADSKRANGLKQAECLLLRRSWARKDQMRFAPPP
jgi:DNA helicase-2/ATP-dependent DNA helicase PcrA